LFAGAGVGQRAGLPTWDGYLEYLASVAENYEKETALLMRKRIRSRLYPEAADLYKMCPVIPEGVKYENLASPFNSYSADKLHALMALPFSAVVTTNYDFSLHDAYVNLFSRQKESALNLTAAKYVELGDASMKQAQYWLDFFIARLHGRAEIPTTIVIDSRDYERIEKDTSYQEFLVHIFKNYKCLFVGYSFLDPAINSVFRLMHDTLPQPFPSLHLALVPADCDPKFTSRLSRFNIEVIKYDQHERHRNLWEAVKIAQRDIRTMPRHAAERAEPVSGLHRFIASCYSRMKISTKAEPLRQIVVEGIVAQSIIDSGPEGITKKELRRVLKKYLSLNDDYLDHLITSAIKGLQQKQICMQSRNQFVCDFEGQKPYDTVIEKLVDGVIHRLSVREGVKAEPWMRKTISDILNRVLLTRGWDLGAHFAGGKPFNTFDNRLQIQTLLEKFSKNLSPQKSKSLCNAILALFRYPDSKEASLLVDVGRIAFGVELIINNARSTTEQSLIIPEMLYLDASVLMPAIVDGHPYGPIYFDTVSRMHELSKKDRTEFNICTANIFLEEIIHHRALALREVQELGLENPEKLQRHALLFGADNTNVYLGAYASWVGRKKEKIPFSTFLEKTAPYATEEGLAKYLETVGIRTLTLSFQSSEEKTLYHTVRDALSKAYDHAESPSLYFLKKPDVLIDHEAKQLTQLLIDLQDGKKPLFVTADKRLMSLLRGQVLESCAKVTISHLGLIQLIDLVVGLGAKTDKRSLARLMWSVEFSDETMSIRNYLIDLALQYYDEAKAMAMWQIVDEIADKATKQAKQEGIFIYKRFDSSKNKARLALLLDRFEDDFFRDMDEAIRAREKDQS